MGRLGRLTPLALCAVLAACAADEGQPSAPGAQKSDLLADSLPTALVLALAQFEQVENEQGRMVPRPGAARLEFLVREGGAWTVRALEDTESNVFHKAMVYRGEGGDRLLTAGGTAAAIKLWTAADGGLEAETLWSEDFGGKWSRMRDVEVADLYGDGSASMAVATHDQGVVAILRPDGQGGFAVERLDHKPDTFVHEIEIGDLDGDGVLEVYATPSEPNRLDGTVQTGEVVRYMPATAPGGNRTVVADLQDRHAKEIFVGDVDGNGTDELYVVVEGHAEGGSLVHGVEVRRYEADTDPREGAVIAEVSDRLARFLTMGDVDGDGKSELVLATFSQGLWLLRPGSDPAAPWRVESIDRDSGGFEHASILADLDGD
ncbi:MAG: VCBS repeat-containing protein, partial [Proteobacteria bacterium]|nr:VCBS repeat-containing protein [Pseudomonadota bacterium]